MAKKHSATAPPVVLLLHTAAGDIECTLTKKRVRNINLRVRGNGSVALSAPANMPMAQIKQFLAEKEPWLTKNRQSILSKQPTLPCTFTKQQCLQQFTKISDEIYPLFSAVLLGQKPSIKVRNMKTRWGTCNIKTRTITLNMRLMEKAADLQEYVVMHEYVHFLHPNHQPPFHAEMARLMPDYKMRRKRLKD